MVKKKKIFHEIRELSEFRKEFKKLSKKFPTLREDLETFIHTQLNLYHKLHIDNRGVMPISDLGIEKPRIYKAKKFACKSLKGKGVHSGIRIIYGYYENEDIVEFIEIYYKGDKKNENRKRILRHYKSCL
ncbi:MAG: hypothetical protein J7L54_01095 [Elusimicrobia bacterium]|nr:hypothetical protein [Elusimicrobiota bacterium]